MDLRAWADYWAAKYPNSESEDAMLAEFDGLTCLTRAQAERLIDWKHQSDARWRLQIRGWFAEETDERVRDATMRAFAAASDYDAIFSCMELRGLGPATDSVLLMGHAPDKYTVIDRRALKSLRALGRLPEGPREARVQDWGPYLAECRKISQELNLSLRVIDRAMYSADGRLNYTEQP